MDNLTTIIVHYNTPKETLACLASLVKVTSTTFNHTIVVIDNGSKEPLELTKDLEKHPIQVLRSESNLGFAGGNNVGIKYALENYTSDFVVLLNSDTTIAKNSLEILIDKARTTPEAGVLNPKIYFTKGMEYHKNNYHRNQLGNIIWFAGGSIDWGDVASFHRGVDEVDRGQFNSVTKTDFATGCCMLIKREVLEAVGLLSEDLFLYWEDVEYSLRVKEKGFELFYVPEATVWHDNAGSSDGAGNNVSVYYQTRNRLYLALTHGGFLAKKAAAMLAFKYIGGTSTEQKAVLDATLRRMGKQTIV